MCMPTSGSGFFIGIAGMIILIFVNMIEFTAFELAMRIPKYIQIWLHFCIPHLVDGPLDPSPPLHTSKSLC